MLAGGPAFFSELRHRDYVVEVGGELAGSADEYREAMRARRTGLVVAVRAWRGERPIETTVRLSRDATAASDVDLLGILEYGGGAERRELSLLWGLLFESSRRYEIEETQQQTVHETSSRWRLLLGLLGYESSPRHPTIRLLWFLPLEFSSR